MTNKKQTRIDLTDSEMFICRTLGVMRRSEAMNKVKDQQMGKNDTWSIDIDGMVGEFCVAKYLNVCPDLTISVRKGGSDLISRQNKTIDVKTTRYKDGRLLATLKKYEDACQIYILVIVDDFGGDIVGWASHEELCNERNKTNLGHGEGYALEQSQLNQFND
jgi:hypothetical protein